MAKSDDLLTHINKHNYFLYQLINELEIHISLFENERNDLRLIRETYGELERKSFNFFESIDKYWYEDFHEIIITQILNPKTKEIGNIEYLNIFFELICMINKECKKIKQFNTNVIIENQIGNDEYGYIDILISNQENAIIVESKINNAEDQKNQLPRYCRYVKNILNKKILAVVYIRPVGDENKMPPVDDYDKSFNDETEIIKKYLVPISIINSKNKIDFCHMFLDICSNKKLTEKASIYIKNYSELLKVMGGIKMTLNIEKEVFKKLFYNTESVVKTTDIGAIWDNRWLIIGSIIQDKLVNDMKFIPDGDKYCYKNINDKLKMTFIYDPEYKKIGDTYVIGFSYESMKQKIKNDLMDLLNNISFEISSIEKSEDIDGWLIVRKFDFILNKTFNDISNDILKMYKTLEKEKENILKIIN